MANSVICISAVLLSISYGLPLLHWIESDIDLTTKTPFRYQHMCSAYHAHTELVYIWGGLRSAQYAPFNEQLCAYNPRTDTCTLDDEFGAKVGCFGDANTQIGNIFYNYNDVHIEVFNVTSLVYESPIEIPEFFPDATLDGDRCLTNYYDQYLLVIGGQLKYFNGAWTRFDTDVISLYDLGEQEWISFNLTLPQPRRNCACNVLNGVLYVMGGDNYDEDVFLDDIVSIDLNKVFEDGYDDWNALDVTNISSISLRSTIFEDFIVVTDGAGPVYMIDTVSDTVIQDGQLTDPIRFTSLIAVEQFNIIYAFGGEPTADLTIYDDGYYYGEMQYTYWWDDRNGNNGNNNGNSNSNGSLRFGLFKICFCLWVVSICGL